jgi:hypothetical protein
LKEPHLDSSVLYSVQFFDSVLVRKSHSAAPIGFGQAQSAGYRRGRKPSGDNPTFMAQRQRIQDGLRKAGVPEE